MIPIDKLIAEITQLEINISILDDRIEKTTDPSLQLLALKWYRDYIKAWQKLQDCVETNIKPLNEEFKK